MRYYSIIIPVYNRPEEIDELLASLTRQSFSNFEVLVIDDGSENPCKHIAEKYSAQLKIRYYFKENSGQGFSRNYGCEKAAGDYFVIFDSDCIIPPHYLEVVHNETIAQQFDAYGGPDKAHPEFNWIQKAISYSMTSLITTGGIRGKKKVVGRFHPRSFNMGYSREVFEKTGGFNITRMGEDILLSIRILEAGFKLGLIPEAYVYHKRRTNFRQFYRQLHFFGRARVNIQRFFPEELKLVHLFPAAFLTGFVFTLLCWWIVPQLAVPLSILFAIYFLMILVDSSLRNRNLWIGILSVVAVMVQFTGYGIGFITEGWRRIRKG